MARQSAVLCALTLMGITSLAWLGVSKLSVHAQAPAASGTANVPDFLANLGTATAAASDGQGSVVLSYPNGIIAVVKPSRMDEVPGKPLPQPQPAVSVYRIRANGQVDKLSLPLMR